MDTTKNSKRAYFFTGWFPGFYYTANGLYSPGIDAAICSRLYLFVQTNKAATAILFAPLVTALLLAIFRVLPFDSRVAIYATWPLIISGMAGIAALSHWLPKLFSRAVTVIIVLVIALPIGVLMLTIAPVRPPFNAQSAQPVLRKLKKQMQPGDINYVYFKARYAMRFVSPENV